MRVRWVWGVILAVLMFSVGCSEPIHHGLSEGAANEMVVVLEQNAIEANKEVDPAGDDLWIVTVASGSRVEAWQVLQNEGLPRPKSSGFGAFYPSSGLIPTASEERIVLQYATALELQQTLLKIEGVVDAHVNLVIPQKPRVQLSGDVVERPRASILVQYRGSAEQAPVTVEGVRALVSGGVEGLEGDAIRVVIMPLARSAEPLLKPAMAQLGPLAVSPRSKMPLQVMFGTMGAMIVALAVVAIYFIVRRKS